MAEADVSTSATSENGDDKPVCVIVLGMVSFIIFLLETASESNRNSFPGRIREDHICSKAHTTIV